MLYRTTPGKNTHCSAHLTQNSTIYLHNDHGQSIYAIQCVNNTGFAQQHLVVTMSESLKCVSSTNSSNIVN